MQEIRKSHALDNVCYDIRGPVLKEAARLEDEGYQLIKLNIGNTAPFGLDTPDEIVHDLIVNVRNAQGYGDSKGLFSARKAIEQDFQLRGVSSVTVDDIYIGNGVSEMIKVAMEGLLNNGDEILVPMPDYPLWTAAITLARGKAVHYLCDEQSDWQPDLDDIRSKITPKTRGLVIINPNNPTGAVYSKETLQQLVALAEEHGLVLFSDEIYDRILYDNREHFPAALFSDKILTITFSGLSKVHRAPGFRCGWMILTGNKKAAKDYIEGLEILTNMRLCANMIAQHTVQTALGGPLSIYELTREGGRLERQRTLAWKLLNEIPGVSCVKPQGALYAFPRLDPKVYPIRDDMQLILELLLEEKVLLVQGTGFNWKQPDHFRLVFLPQEELLEEAVSRLASFLERWRSRNS